MPTRIPMMAAPVLLIAAPAQAQQQDEQAWLQVNANVPVADGVRLTLEQITRVSNRREGLYQTEFGGLLGVRVARTVELGFGYRRFAAYNGDTGADEDRLRQQVVATFGAVTARLRVDERFNPGGDEIGARVRPYIRYNRPLATKGLALFVSHESFVLANSTRWGQRSGYDRMRNILGVAFPLAKGFAAEVGYLNQYRFGRSGARDQMDHVLNLQLTINLRDIVAPHVHD